jgi:diguanylate cyclase (GGDEF)-like protein
VNFDSLAPQLASLDSPEPLQTECDQPATDTMSAEATPSFELSRWRAEFLDRQTERNFVQRDCRQSTAYVRRHILLTGLFFMLCAASHAASTDSMPTSGILLALCGITVVVVLGMLLWVGRRPQIIASGLASTLFVLWLIAGFGVMLKLEPESLGTYAMGPVLLVAIIYLFLPNRLHCMAALAAIATLEFTLTLWPEWHHAPLFLDFALMLIVVNALGYSAARRLAVTRREQYCLLIQSEAAQHDLREEIQRRRAAEAELEHRATTDCLTGLKRRCAYLEASAQELDRAERYGHPMALIMLDVDHFKHVNDRWGHAAGDHALQRVANIVREELRSHDIAGRLGGEEFAINLPQTDLVAAKKTADRLCQRIERARLEQWPDITLSVTVGITMFQPGDAVSAMLSRADAALYLGKRRGRGCVVVAPERILANA